MSGRLRKLVSLPSICGFPVMDEPVANCSNASKAAIITVVVAIFIASFSAFSSVKSQFVQAKKNKI